MNTPEHLLGRFASCKEKLSLVYLFRSPERLQGLDYSYPSDIWSLGVVVFEMVTGEHPFPKTNRPIEIHNYIKQSPAPSLIGSPLVSIECADFISRW